MDKICTATLMLPRQLLVLVLRGYKLFISPWLGQNCRFYPGCANYAIEAIQRYGVFKGGGLTALRLCKCHPLHKGGYDPVPEKSATGRYNRARARNS